MEKMNQIYTFDGLDATGKSTLLSLAAKDGHRVINSPPNCIKQYRSKMDDASLETRFFYYLTGNEWIDKNVLKEGVDKDQLILVDRSVLSTLSSHELRGISQEYLEIGFEIAKTFIRPCKSIVVHTDEEERRERLFKRTNLDKIDLQNLSFAKSMEPAYEKWAQRLGWNLVYFDNSGLTIEQSYLKMWEVIQK